MIRPIVLIKVLLSIAVYFANIITIKAQDTKPKFNLTKGGNVAYKNAKLYDSKTDKQQTKKIIKPTDKETDRVAFEYNLLNNPQNEKHHTNLPVIHTYTAFKKQIIGPSAQQNRQNFTLHKDNSKIARIKMFVKLDCEETGCPPWDVFGNIQIKDPNSNTFFELGRFMTPYGKSTSQLERGFEFDVTDFKSILNGEVDLKTRIITWSKRWLITIEFDFEEGTPDYPYYAVSNVFNYGYGPQTIAYGKSHDLDLTRTVTLPSNTEKAYLRTTISGWGHATPVDTDKRPCAEWCYRTHNIKINNVSTFSHYMGPIGCSENPIRPQSGNWSPDRAGWCPGMGVPIRIDELNSSKLPSTFDLEYDFEDWTTDGGKTSGTHGAFYSLSQIIVVKSHSKITAPLVLK